MLRRDLVFLIIIHKDEGRNSQKVKEVNPNTEAHNIGYEYNPTVGIGG